MATSLNTIRNRLSQHLSTDAGRRCVIGILLSFIPLYILRSRLFRPGFAYPGDFTSNLFPALMIRWELTHGQMPFYTHLWYGGEYILFNPLFKGFYPIAWPLYIPGIPLLPAMKLLLAAHYAATVVIAYWYASREFSWGLAAPFALLFVTPMATFAGHVEMVFGWPWLVLFVWHITDKRMRTDSLRSGVIAGGALGVALLAGDNYHFFYGGLLLASLVFATREWRFGGAAIVGSLISLPKVLFSIIPTMLLETNRPTGGPSLSPEGVFAGLTGIRPGMILHLSEIGSISWEGGGIVGVGALCLAGGVLAIAYMRPGRLENRPQWFSGLVLAGVLSLLLVSRSDYLYWLPVVSIFRVGARAIVLTSLCVLLLCWAGARLSVDRSRTLQVVVAGLLVLSAVNAVGAWTALSNGQASQPTIDDRVSDDIEQIGCSTVWMEGSLAGTKTPFQKQIAYALLNRGIALQAVNYGKIGQEYTARRNGQYTFGALIVGKKLTRPQYTLTGGWGHPARGTIITDELTHFQTYQTAHGPLYVYLTPRCSSSDELLAG